MIHALIALAAFAPAPAITVPQAPPALSGTSPPRLLSLPSPSLFYPPAAMAMGLEGRTLLRCRLPVDGVLADCVVHQSSGAESLDSAALSLASHARYSPMIEGGVEREAVVILPIRWKLAE